MRQTLQSTWQTIARLWDSDLPPEGLDAALAELRAKQPAPTLWLLGKTQSGKTSIVKYLTGADDAAVGNGFQPTTRTSRRYPFPNTDAPVMTFLDTRGLDEAGYDPREDVAAFAAQTQLVIVTVKVTDFAQASLKDFLRVIRRERSGLPVLLVLTCLHEALAGKPHPAHVEESVELMRLTAEHREQFAGLVDAVVLVDLTRPEEGFADPHYNGESLQKAILEQLPSAYRQSLLHTADALAMLKDLHQRNAAPLIVGYASLASTAAAVPVPFVSLVTLPAIQARMMHHLAKLYGREMTTTRMLELAGSLGIGLISQLAVREAAKLIPFVGSAVGATIAWASTYALGKAICLYFEEVHDGHLPKPERLKSLYFEQFQAAKSLWAGGS